MNDSEMVSEPVIKSPLYFISSGIVEEFGEQKEVI